MYIESFMFRSSPPELSPTKTLSKYGANSQENKRTEAQSQQSCFPTLLKSHSCTNALPRIHIIPTKHLYPGMALRYILVEHHNLSASEKAFSSVTKNFLLERYDWNHLMTDSLKPTYFIFCKSMVGSSQCEIPPQ